MRVRSTSTRRGLSSTFLSFLLTFFSLLNSQALICPVFRPILGRIPRQPVRRHVRRVLPLRSSTRPLASKSQTTEAFLVIYTLLYFQSASASDPPSRRNQALNNPPSCNLALTSHHLQLSRMSSESPLPQAYKKASEAELHAEARPPRLAEAVSAHEEAAILFARAEEQTEDDGVSPASTSSICCF